MSTNEYTTRLVAKLVDTVYAARRENINIDGVRVTSGEMKAIRELCEYGLDSPTGVTLTSTIAGVNLYEVAFAREIPEALRVVRTDYYLRS